MDRAEIQRFKRTRKYAPEDYELLLGVLSRFSRVHVTPHVLTEASNLVGQLQDNLRTKAYARLAQLVPTWAEDLVPSAVVVTEPLFRRLGLTDAALARAARDPVVVLTDDLDLYQAVWRGGGQALDFTHLRSGTWAL